MVLEPGGVLHNTEAYDYIAEHPFREPANAPLSTFAVDVDTASYSNVRRFLNAGRQPPKDAVRIEELINYFGYEYPEPDADVPFSINTEVASCPWKTDHLLVSIGLKGRAVPWEDIPPLNLVFLLDVSGSMNTQLKLPLLKSAMRLLVAELRSEDRLSIVVYAGASGLVLPPTSGADKATIRSALDSLSAGGSTAGGSGIRLAYEVARRSFDSGGVNRVILATDGDFNVGVSSQGELVRLIEAERESGVFLSVLGFGMGNLKDAHLEQLADHGNGNYAYIDSLREARRVLVQQAGSTLVTIAKDVKIQVEFNPRKVAAYRLIGYENRALRAEDFNDDRKDAGDIGAGHRVTALYEIVPVGVSLPVPAVDALKYRQPAALSDRADSDELATVKLRYKEPGGDTSRRLVTLIEDPGSRDASQNLSFAASVAGFGMLLRDSEYKGELTFGQVLELARGARGADPSGDRSEFIQLVELARALG